ncbi:MAG: hypothetical protein JWO92_689 [Chitinophagaceae bacterium]|nr:hypothetical protein [Chitinophagaceae bacterium]MDB5222378.1 hypothetical protein [Chitinophagaceae bacterium]
MKMNTDKAARWIANGILKVQKKFANTLDRISASWKTKHQWIFLYLVSLVFGGLSIVAVIKPFNKKAQNVLPKPAAIRTPRSVPNEDRQSVKITDNEIRQVQNFKRSLDSASKKKLLEERPGLMDSLEMVEQLYYSQKK